jgi:hypothetical protein
MLRMIGLDPQICVKTLRPKHKSFHRCPTFFVSLRYLIGNLARTEERNCYRLMEET